MNIGKLGEQRFERQHDSESWRRNDQRGGIGDTLSPVVTDVAFGKSN
jgi:hypothetical protein